jgi:hypothetical protein
MLAAALPRSWLRGRVGIGNATHHTIFSTTNREVFIMSSELLNDDVEICVDCYTNHHEGNAMADTSVDWTDNTNANDDDGETGITDFSSVPCACCGSHLAGSRYRMAIWALPTTDTEGTK